LPRSPGYEELLAQSVRARCGASRSARSWPSTTPRAHRLPRGVMHAPLGRPICRHWPQFCTPAVGPPASTPGHRPCFSATGGASRRPSRLRVRPTYAFAASTRHGSSGSSAPECVTHLSAARAARRMIASTPEAMGPALSPSVDVQTGGVPPSPTLLARLTGLGMTTLTSRRTETYDLSRSTSYNRIGTISRARTRRPFMPMRASKRYIAHGLRVVHPDRRNVPDDRETMGEIVEPGNHVMLGCYRDEQATATSTG
jgi:hypothetical protein